MTGSNRLRIVLVAAGLLATSPALADEAERCQAMALADFSRLADAPTQILRAGLAPATVALPAFCAVEGYVAPAVGFELRMPTAGWNGKYFQAGCGGLCGSLVPESCDIPLAKGYACLVTDQGHRSSFTDGKWAFNNLPAELDHAYRATHVVALAGKAITERFYRSMPARSYFWGCSGGGRQGLMEAQRFPWDFDGIIAGAPVMDLTGAYMNLLWYRRALVTAAGKPVLGAAELQLLHAAVLAQCDRDDAAADGIIGKPTQCHFDPARLACARGQTAHCLKPDQVAAVRKFYAGPTTSKGETIYLAGAPSGSELTWAVHLPAASTIGPDLGEEALRYNAFLPDPGPSWQAADFNFDVDYQRLGMMEALGNAGNPDLRRFKAAGGKLLIYQGGNDIGAAPANVIDYYKTATRTMGGAEHTRDFFRLFLVPGMNHCSGGDGAFAIDYIQHLEAWVEEGRAPDMMIGAHLKDARPHMSASGAPARLSFPLDPNLVAFTRPIFAWPAFARYAGQGDINAALSFIKTEPN